MRIVSKPPTPEYGEAWERVFGKMDNSTMKPMDYQRTIKVIDAENKICDNHVELIVDYDG